MLDFLIRPVQKSKSVSIFLMVNLFLFGFITLNCQSSLSVNDSKSEYKIEGRWTIHYLKSAETILKARNSQLDILQVKNAERHLKQQFYGEFTFDDSMKWNLFYKVNGSEKKGGGEYTIRDRSNDQLSLIVTELKGGQPTNDLPEILLIQFIEPNQILLSKEGDKELPPLVFQREITNP